LLPLAATQSSPAIWYPANAFMGWALLIAAVISAVLLTILPATVKRWLLLATFLVPVLGAIAASFVYLNRLS
jgi:predicted neutral ceramidase superfamily lipid hydrolase